MDLKIAVKIVREFMGSYCGEHGEAMRAIVADVERRKTVRRGRPCNKPSVKSCATCENIKFDSPGDFCINCVGGSLWSPRKT